MNRKLLVIACGLILMSLSGCVSTMLVEKATSVVAPDAKDKFSFDLSTPGADTGKLIVQCVPPTNLIFANKYAIKVDSYAALVVTKQSDTDIKLNTGKHSVKFYVVDGKAGLDEKVAFGKATTREIDITKDKEQSLKYTGPWRYSAKEKLKQNRNKEDSSTL